ncbi:MAG: CDP-diacylglycerol--serine O-phosphatidyltransferase, partial [Novibacillus thermophilus]
MLAKVLPNVITIGNLFFGLLALKLVHDGLWEFAAITVIAGMLCDGLDGIVARMLKTESAFGKELDSLSDMVTFGVAPAFIMYVAVLHEIGVIGWVVSVVFPVCGALRLARFNVRKGIPGYFVG